MKTLFSTPGIETGKLTATFRVEHRPPTFPEFIANQEADEKAEFIQASLSLTVNSRFKSASALALCCRTNGPVASEASPTSPGSCTRNRIARGLLFFLYSLEISSPTRSKFRVVRFLPSRR
jgi:hypothetical protein